METNKTKMFSSVLLFGVGLLVGWFLWGARVPREGSHMMPGGSMMEDEHPMMHGAMSMNQMMDTMTGPLKGKSDAAFDEEFLEQMIPHHQGAVEMARLVLSNTKRPELIKLANEIIEAQQREINLMREWQKKWFGVQAE